MVFGVKDWVVLVLLGGDDFGEIGFLEFIEMFVGDECIICSEV